MNNLAVSVAVIDDDNLYRFILAKAFDRSGMPVIFHAENGKLGLDQMENCPILPRVVIIDIEMPVMDGYETTRRLKSRWPEIGIIAHSSSSDFRVKDLIIQSGADIFLPKAAGKLELLNTVKQLALKMP